MEVSQKPDSQDICFVPDGKYTSVLSKLKPEGYKKGNVVSKGGDFLAEHNGIVNFTIGQRRGLGLAVGEPLYVIDINPITLDVTVGSKEDLKKEILHLRDVNWIGDDEFINQTYKVKVKIGSTLNLEGADLVSTKDSVSVKLDSGIREGISPGQACVFYDNQNSSRVLGGGWIYDNRLS